METVSIPKDALVQFGKLLALYGIGLLFDPTISQEAKNTYAVALTSYRDILIDAGMDEKEVVDIVDPKVT